MCTLCQSSDLCKKSLKSITERIQDSNLQGSLLLVWHSLQTGHRNLTQRIDNFIDLQHRLDSLSTILLTSVVPYKSLLPTI